MNIQLIPLTQLVPSPLNVRKTGTKTGIEALAASIAAHGLLQNLQVRPGNGKTSKCWPEDGGLPLSICWRRKRQSPVIFRCRAMSAKVRTRPKSALPKTRCARRCIPPTSSRRLKNWPTKA